MHIFEASIIPLLTSVVFKPLERAGMHIAGYFYKKTASVQITNTPHIEVPCKHTDVSEVIIIAYHHSFR